jgi:hypothetical protein
MAFKEKKEKKSTPLDDSTRGELARRFKANPAYFIGTVVILIIVIVAFVLVPALVPGVSMSSMNNLTFGVYDKTPISYVPGGYFAQIRENIALNQQNSGNDASNLFVNYQIWRGAFEQTVVHTAILSAMKKAGYTAPDLVVDRNVAALPQFQENGRFSVLRYRAMDNTSRSALWREVRDEIAEERYLNDVTGLTVSSKEAPFIRAMASPERSFDMAALSLSAYPDAEIIAFAAANPALFRVAHLSKITTKSEREAKQILTNVQNGTTTFEEAAKAYSIDTVSAEKGGDTGLKMAYELISEIPEAADRDALFALTPGSFSAIIKTGAGWNFFRAEEAPRPADTSDASVLQKMRAYLMDFERGRVEDYFIKEADSLIAAAAANGFDAAVAEKGLETRHFGPLPINYGSNQLLPSLDTSLAELSGAASNENFWRVAFSTPLNTASQSFVVGDKVLVLFPIEQKAADETNAGYIETAYSSYWLSYMMEQTVHSYFLNDGKLKDDFMNMFFKYFQPGLN